MLSVRKVSSPAGHLCPRCQEGWWGGERRGREWRRGEGKGGKGREGGREREREEGRGEGEREGQRGEGGKRGKEEGRREDRAGQ